MARGLAWAALVWLPLAGLLTLQPCFGVAIVHTPLKKRKRKVDSAFAPSGQALRQPVSKIFFINLANSTERREDMQQILAANADGVPYERFEAVTKVQALNEPPYVDIVKAQGVGSAFLSPNNSFRMPGAVACYMSHRFLLEKISKLENKDSIYVVVEDDIDVKKGWYQRLASIWPRIPTNWDLIKLGYVGTEWPCDEISQGVYVAKLAGGASRNIGCNRNYLGTQAYAVTPRSAARVLDVMYKTEVRDVDTILCTGMQCAHRIPGKATANVYGLADMKPYFTADPAKQSNSTIGRVVMKGSIEECKAALAALKPGDIDCNMLRRPKNRSGPFDVHPTLSWESLHSGPPYVDEVLHQLFPNNGNGS